MFDVSGSEFLLVVVVAVLVIGPKDMPVALRIAGRFIGKMRRMSNHFRSGFETMIREAEMEEMEKKWQEQNRQVMEQHPAIEMTAANNGGADMVPLLPPADSGAAEPQAVADPEGLTQLEHDIGGADTAVKPAPKRAPKRASAKKDAG